MRRRSPFPAPQAPFCAPRPIFPQEGRKTSAIFPPLCLREKVFYISCDVRIIFCRVFLKENFCREVLSKFSHFRIVVLTSRPSLAPAARPPPRSSLTRRTAAAAHFLFPPSRCNTRAYPFSAQYMRKQFSAPCTCGVRSVLFMTRQEVAFLGLWWIVDEVQYDLTSVNPQAAGMGDFMKNAVVEVTLVGSGRAAE